jgi:hypothetical protein
MPNSETGWLLNAFDEIYQRRNANLKRRWLEINDHKKIYWQQWLSLGTIKKIGREMYLPNTEEIANYMIRERTIEVCEKRICCNPHAFCWASGKSLFLKPATVVHTLITGPGDSLKEKFYFEPKRYTVWLLES